MSSDYRQLYDAIGYTFADESLLRLALTHASVGAHNYERLEYLGDALLDFAVGEHLYRALPDATEGELTQKRAQIVSNTVLSRLFELLQLRHLLVSQNLSLRSLSEKVRANFVESLIGALYLDGGMEAANAFIMRFVVQNASDTVDYVSRLLEYGAISKIAISIQEKSVGTINKPRFEASVFIGDRLAATAQGDSKKAAKTEACRQVWQQLQ